MDGELALNPQWPDVISNISCIAMGKAVVTIALYIYTVVKMRKLAATIIALQQCTAAKSLLSTLPSFIYHTEKPEIPDSHYSFDFDITMISWEHATIVFLVIICFLLSCI